MSNAFGVSRSVLIIASWFIVLIEAQAQDTKLSWSTFTVGFAISKSTVSNVKSAVGEAMVGMSRQENSQTLSGFLADTSLRHVTVGVREGYFLTGPFTFMLDQNFPNPFNPLTRIEYTIPRREYVNLQVYDVLGRLVASLVDGIQEPGIQSVDFIATDVPTGMYFYRLRTVKFATVRKMLLIR